MLQKYGAYLLDTSNSQIDRDVLHTKVLVADCIVAVFDVSRPETFQSEMFALLQKISTLICSMPRLTPVIMVGNKMDKLALVECGRVPSSFMKVIQTTIQEFPFICGCMFTSVIDPGYTDCTPVGTIFQLAIFYARVPPQVLYDRTRGSLTAATKKAALCVFWQLDYNKRHKLDESALEQIEKICFGQKQSTDSFARQQVWHQSCRGERYGGVTAQDFLLFCEVSACQMCLRTSLESFLSFWLFLCSRRGDLPTDLTHNLSMMGALEHAAYVFKSFLALNCDLSAQEKGNHFMPLELVIELMSYCDPTPQREYTLAWSRLLQSRDAPDSPVSCIRIGASDSRENQMGNGNECGGECNRECNWSCSMRLGEGLSLMHGCSPRPGWNFGGC